MSQKNPEFPPVSVEAWQKAAAKSAPGGDLRALDWRTPDGITVKALYTAEDTKDLPNANTVPGFEPYLRGPQATMYAVRPWTIRQYADVSTAEESHPFYRNNLDAGQMALSVAIPLASTRCYATDHPRTAAHTSRTGLQPPHVRTPRLPPAHT